MLTALEPKPTPGESESATIGKIVVEVECTNSDDVAMLEKGLFKPDQVRRAKLSTLVDTGATLLSLPEEVIQKLGLRLFKEVQSRFANGQSAVRKIYGPVVVNVMGRSDIVLAMAGYPGMPALLGQIPLEGLDLMVDPKNQRLVPGHPESPDVQMVEVYQSKSSSAPKARTSTAQAEAGTPAQAWVNEIDVKKPQRGELNRAISNWYSTPAH